MNLTKHANLRKHQRGFSNFTLDMIMKFGSYKKASGGAIKVFFGNKEYQNTIKEFKKAIQLLDRAKGGNIVIKDNFVITVYK